MRGEVNSSKKNWLCLHGNQFYEIFRKRFDYDCSHLVTCANYISHFHCTLTFHCNRKCLHVDKSTISHCGLRSHTCLYEQYDEARNRSETHVGMKHSFQRASIVSLARQKLDISLPPAWQWTWFENGKQSGAKIKI